MIILSVLLILVLVCIDNSSELVKLISELKQRGYAEFQLSEKLIVGSYKIYDLGLGDTIVIYCENRGVIWVMRFHEGVLVNQEIREYSNDADNSETRQLG